MRQVRLEELYRQHSPQALRFAYLMTGDHDLAEDLMHEAFIKATGRFVHLRDPSAFGGYLRRTIISLTRSHWRRRRTERTSTEKLGRMAAAERGGPDIEARVALQKALLELSPRQRAAIVLRFYEDLSESQTADILGCANGTVKSLVSRGMSTLRSSVPTDV